MKQIAKTAFSICFLLLICFLYSCDVSQNNNSDSLTQMIIDTETFETVEESSKNNEEITEEITTYICDHSFGDWYVIRDVNTSISGEGRRNCLKEGCNFFQSLPVSNWLEYSINDDHTTCTITGTQYSDSPMVIIPYNIEGYEVTQIGKSAFANCSKLQAILIPNSIISIDESAFKNCISLTIVHLPNDITNLPDSIFSGCNSLTSIYIPSNVNSIGSGAFKGCSNLTSIHIPNKVTIIGRETFWGCHNLIDVKLPNEIKRIEPFVFMQCYNLTSIEIPSTVTFIGDSAFSSCSSLININIPKKVTHIGSYAFANCDNLMNIYFENTYGWWITDVENTTSGNSINFTDNTSENALLIKERYWSYLNCKVDNTNS